MQRIFVALCVIDDDYEGEIKVMTHSLDGISVIKTGQRPAQLILLPQVQRRNQVKGGERGEAGFGLSDAYWLQAIGPQQPEFTL